MVQTYVEPHGRIESTVLIHAQPGQLIVEDFAVCLGEVFVLYAPVCDRAADAVDHLADALFTLIGLDIAVKILGDNNLGGKLGPELGNFDFFLTEEDIAGIIIDFRGAVVPFDFIKGAYFGGAEYAINFEHLPGGLEYTRTLGSALCLWLGLRHFCRNAVYF